MVYHTYKYVVQKYQIPQNTAGRNGLVNVAYYIIIIITMIRGYYQEPERSVSRRSQEEHS
jgi:hypothetical protein